MKVATILGTRPEIIKLSPLIPLLEKEGEHILIHTGQHYDHEMDAVFFEELRLPQPKYNLRVGSGHQGEQTGKMIQLLEPILLDEKPGVVIIQGDTNTVLAGAITASKLHIPIAHIEAGCRSFNKKMPEEINRIIADHVSNYLFAADEKSRENLLHEGITPRKITVTGNTAYDACLRAEKLAAVSRILEQLRLEPGKYLLMTIHRAESTDPEILPRLITALNILAAKIPVIFPIHPRTRKAIEDQRLSLNQNVLLLKPQGYINFIKLLSACRYCVSDSGGIQDEALALNIPCLIPRTETEWPLLVESGKNFVVGNKTESILAKAEELLDDAALERIKRIPVEYIQNAAAAIMSVLKHVH